MTQLETEALEVLHLMEDMVEYHCDGTNFLERKYG